MFRLLTETQIYSVLNTPNKNLLRIFCHFYAITGKGSQKVVIEEDSAMQVTVAMARPPAAKHSAPPQRVGRPSTAASAARPS